MLSIVNPVFSETGQRETIVVWARERGGSMPRGGFVLSCVVTHREPAADIDWLAVDLGAVGD